MRHRFSLSFSAASSRGASTGSAVSSKLMKIDELVLEDLRGVGDRVVRADRAVGPHFERELVVVGLLTDARVGDLKFTLRIGENSESIGIVPTGMSGALLRSAGT